MELLDRLRRLWSTQDQARHAVPEDRGGTLADFIASQVPPTREVDDEVQRPERRSKPRVSARKDTRVLIIDDSATVVAMLGRMLRENGYRTFEALSAEIGLELARKARPELVFLDIVLPGMDGFAALRSLRRDPDTEPVPVIMISGNLQATEQFYVERIGADDFIKKPFSRAEVFARIERLLDDDFIPRRSEKSRQRSFVGAVPLPGDSRAGQAADTTATIIPCLRYRDAPAMIDWLCRAFGFEKHVVHADGDTVHHAQLVFGNGMVMLGSAGTGGEWASVIAQPGEIGARETQSPCVIVADADTHYAHAKAAGADIVQEIADQGYGGRGYLCRDPEGHLWWFGSYDPWKDPS